MQTTIAHIIIERLRLAGVHINFPDHIKGDMMKEHAWAMFSQEGPKLMVNHKELFENVCKEIDHAIAEGVAIFGDDGLITIKGYL